MSSLLITILLMEASEISEVFGVFYYYAGVPSLLSHLQFSNAVTFRLNKINNDKVETKLILKIFIHF